MIILNKKGTNIRLNYLNKYFSRNVNNLFHVQNYNLNFQWWRTNGTKLECSFLEILTILFWTLYKMSNFCGKKKKKKCTKKSMNFKIAEERWIFNHCGINCSSLKWFKKLLSILHFRDFLLPNPSNFWDENLQGDYS